MANSTLPFGFVKTTLQNGVGRYICQLQRVTITFCKTYPNSSGVRDFIEHDLVDFARKNPSVVVYVKPRRHRPPYLEAEYINGHNHTISCHKFEREEVIQWLEYLKGSSGFPVVRLMQLMHTNVPSIQGTWTPFMNLPTRWNITDFPDEKSSQCHPDEKSATEILLDLVKNNPNIVLGVDEKKN